MPLVIYTRNGVLHVPANYVTIFREQGGGYVKTQLSLYLIYYTDDTFRPVWAILRSQNVKSREVYSV